MIVLCSNGLTGNALMTHLAGRAAGCKTAALVVTADNEYKENNYHVPRCISELETLNLHVEVL